jgi:Ca2+-transporting ATPase
VQGAAECVLERCTKVLLNTGLTVPMGEEMRAQVLAAVDRITSRGLRCLAFGIKTNLGGQSWFPFDKKGVLK